MAGQEVARPDLDYRMSQTLVSARNVVRDLETIAAFLERAKPDANGVDLLVLPVDEGGKFGYTEDEATLIRSTSTRLSYRPSLKRSHDAHHHASSFVAPQQRTKSSSRPCRSSTSARSLLHRQR
jgi:hypothetical protein